MPTTVLSTYAQNNSDKRRLTSRLAAAPVAAALLLAGLSTPAVAAAASTAGSAKSTGSVASAADPVAVALAQAVRTGRPVTVAADTTQTHLLTANPDNTLTSTDTPLPVRVKQHGSWVPVNATLARNADGSYSPTATPGGVRISGGGKGPLATLTDPAGHTLSYTLPFDLPTPTVTGSGALYAGVLPGVDLSVQVTDQAGFSEVLVVHNAAAAADPDLAKLTLATSTSGLTLSTDSHGDLSAKAANGSVSFTAPEPVMWDSSTASATPGGQPNSHSLAAAPAASAASAASTAAGPGRGAQVEPVADTLGTHTLTLKPSTALLGGGKHPVFPVFIDPYTNPATNATGDFDEVYSSSECNGSPQFDKAQTDGEGVGYMQWGDGCGIGLERSYYNVSLANIPSTAQGIASTVTAPDTYAASYNCSENQPVTLHTTGSIGSSTDWNNQPGTDDSTYPTASTTVPSGSNPSSSCSNKNAVLTVTDAVKKLVANGVTSWTFALFGDESQSSSDDDFLRFSTKLSINTTFDVPPNTPTNAHTVPDAANPSGAGCNNTGTGWIGAAGAAGVTLAATVSTPMAGEEVAGHFVIWDNTEDNGSGGAKTLSTPTTSNLASGSTAQTSFTPQDGHAYGWGVEAIDNSSQALASPYISECHFNYDNTPPSTPTVTSGDPSFPQVGSGAPNPVKYAGTGTTISLPVTATDPLPAATCTLGSCHASGISSFLWDMDTEPTPLAYAGKVTPTSTGTDSTGAPTASATITVPVTAWGVHTLYIMAVDQAGNPSQSPVGYTFTAPWNPNTKVTPGDLTGDGVPDLVAATSTGDLELIPGNTDPAQNTQSSTQSYTSSSNYTGPVLISTAADAPGGAGDSWSNYQIAHRGNLFGQSVDDLFALNTKVTPHVLYDVKNDLDPVASGAQPTVPGFTLGRNLPLTKPGCAPVNTPPANRCGSNAGYDSTDWNDATQIAAPGDVYQSGEPDLITVENGQLWLYEGISGGSLANPVLLGDGDWSNFTLITPGTVAGSPTLWVRDKTTGNVYTFNIAPSTTTGLPPLLQAPNTTVTTLVSGVAATGGGTLCLADPAANTTDGTDMITWGCEAGHAEQTFAIAADGTVRVLGKCLDVYHSGTANATAVDLYTCNGSGAQTWTEGADGSLVNPESGKCLADPAANPAPDTAVMLWTCDNGSEQNWNSGNAAALPTPPASTAIINLPTTSYPRISSPGDVNSPLSTTDTTGSPDGNPDLYVVDANGQLIEYPGGPANSGTATFAAPVSLGTVTNTATHAWTLADGSGTTAHDTLDSSTVTPNPGLDATLTGSANWNTDTTLTKADPALTAGGNLQLDGTTGYAATTGPAVNTTGDYTVSVWAKLNSFAAGSYYTVVAQRDSSGVRSGFYLQYSAAFKSWALVMPGTDAANTPTYYHANGNTAPVVNQWYHLVATYQAATGSMSLYINGKLAGTGTDTGTPWAATGPLLIGAQDGGTTPGNVACFPGQIADLHIYDTALPAADAAALGDSTPITGLN